jgi:hypothetical protein
MNGKRNCGKPFDWPGRPYRTVAKGRLNSRFAP